MVDQSKKILIDNALQALELYFEFSPAACNKVISSGEREVPPGDTRNGSGQLRITGIEQIGPAGAVVAAFQTGESATLRLHYETLDTVADVNVGIQILDRSEEHTSELQSLMRISYAVFCLKKKISKYEPHATSLQSHQLLQQNSDKQYI